MRTRTKKKLIECKNTISPSLKKIASLTTQKRFLDEAGNVIKAGAGGDMYTRIYRTTAWCDPQRGSAECNQIAQSGSLYLTIAIGCVNVLLEFLKERYENRHGTSSKKFSSKAYTIWDGLINIVGRNSFLLQFFLYIYTEIAIFRGEEKDKDIGINEIWFYTALVVTFILATLSNAKVRNELAHLAAKPTIISKRRIYNIKRVLDFAFEALAGFSTARAWVAVIEALINRYSGADAFHSTVGVSVRYGLACPWGIFSGYATLKKPFKEALSITPGDVVSLVSTTPERKHVLKQIADSFNQFFSVFFFSIFILFTLIEEKEPHQSIHATLFGLLALTVIWLTIFSNLFKKPLPQEEINSSINNDHERGSISEQPIEEYSLLQKQEDIKTYTDPQPIAELTVTGNDEQIDTLSHFEQEESNGAANKSKKAYFLSFFFKPDKAEHKHTRQTMPLSLVNSS